MSAPTVELLAFLTQGGEASCQRPSITLLALVAGTSLVRSVRHQEKRRKNEPDTWGSKYEVKQRVFTDLSEARTTRSEQRRFCS